MDRKTGGKEVDINHSPHVLKTMEGRATTVARAAVGIPVSFQYTENLFMKRMKSLPKEFPSGLNGQLSAMFNSHSNCG